MPNCPQIIYSECRMDHGLFQIGFAVNLKATPKETAGWPLVISGQGSSPHCSLGAGRDFQVPELMASLRVSVASTTLSARRCHRRSKSQKTVQHPISDLSDFNQECIKMIKMKAQDDKPSSLGKLHIFKYIRWDLQTYYRPFPKVSPRQEST